MERDVERYLKLKVEQIGGRAYKFVSPSYAGMPDRIVVVPPNIVIFVELKQKGGEISAIQKVRHRELRDMGCWVEVIWNNKDVLELINTIQMGKNLLE